MTVHVVLDSTAHISPEMLARHPNLHVVQLKVMIGENQWLEDQLPTDELFQLVERTKYYPKTSQPSPGDFAEVFEPIVQSGDSTVVITLSGQLSGTVQSAKTGSQLVGGKNIHVIDSGTTAVGMVRMAQTALQMAAQDRPAAEIADAVRAMGKATSTIFVPDTLEYLYKGGRIGGAAALFGTILQIRPILYLTDGKVAVLDKVRTRRRAIERMAEELKTDDGLAYIGVVHIAAAEALALQNRIKQLHPDVPVSLTACGAVLGAHLGPGILGIIFQRKLTPVSEGE